MYVCPWYQMLNGVMPVMYTSLKKTYIIRVMKPQLGKQLGQQVFAGH